MLYKAYSSTVLRYVLAKKVAKFRLCCSWDGLI